MSVGPTIDHIGVIVENLEEASKSLARFLGIAPDPIKEMPEVGLRLASFKAANITIELIEYLSGENNFGRAAMGNQTGLNHLSVKVDDIGDAIKQKERDGFKLLSGFPVEGASGTVAFFDPDPASGIRMEICQHHKREEE